MNDNQLMELLSVVHDQERVVMQKQQEVREAKWELEGLHREAVGDLARGGHIEFLKLDVQAIKRSTRKRK